MAFFQEFILQTSSLREEIASANNWRESGGKQRRTSCSLFVFSDNRHEKRFSYMYSISPDYFSTDKIDTSFVDPHELGQGYSDRI